MMPNYKRSIIYKLTSFDGLVYYGASTGPLKTRFTRHKLSSKEELTERLDYYIDHNICVNKRNPKKRKKVGITQARQIVKIRNIEYP
jgi:hypothetical protein